MLAYRTTEWAAVLLCDGWLVVKLPRPSKVGKYGPYAPWRVACARRWPDLFVPTAVWGEPGIILQPYVSGRYATRMELRGVWRELERRGARWVQDVSAQNVIVRAGRPWIIDCDFGRQAGPALLSDHAHGIEAPSRNG